MLSARAACERLRVVGLSRRHAQRVLDSGLAGPPTRLPSATLFDAARVEHLVTWPTLEEAAIDAACPWGLFVGRRQPQRPVTSDGQWGRAGVEWDMPAVTGAWIRICVDRHGFLPFVQTVGGFVVLGADIVDVRVVTHGDGGLQQRERRLLLREPGAWFDALQHRRLVTGAGPPYLIRGRHPTAGGGPGWGVGECGP